MKTTAPVPEDIRSMWFRIVFFCHLYMNAVAYNWTCIESDAVLMDRTCYIFSNVSLAWENANKACVDKQSILASVFSEEDIREILSLLPQAHVESSSFSAWVGANDMRHEGTFVWRVNNGTVIEDVWKGDGPSNTEDKDCAAIDATMRLTVEKCSDHKPALCMYMLKEPKITKFMDKFTCRCSDGECDSNGDCPNTGKCLIGHFGPGCQYRNLHSNLHGKYKALNDYDSTTCLWNISQPLHIKLPHMHYVTWIRIVVEDKSPVNPFTLALPYNGSYKECLNPRFVSLDGFTFDMWCKGGPHVLDDFQISWDDNISVCQIYFNGGRNMAFNVARISHFVGVHNYPVAYDDIKGRGAEIMTAHRSHVKTSAYLNIIYDNYIKIREQMLYKQIKYNYFHNNFTQFGVGIDYRIFSAYTHGTDETNPIAWFRTDFDSTVNAVRVQAYFTEGNDTSIMEVQEFESYGECPAGRYNLQCSSTCPENCDPQGCLEIYGLCYRCKDGREVSNCPDLSTSTTTVTTTPANTTESPENVTIAPTNDDSGMGGDMGGGAGGGMGGVTGTLRTLPPMSTVVARPPKSENLWEYIVYGLVSAATVLAVVPLLCLCHARCAKPVGEAEAQGEMGNAPADGYSDMDRKLTPAELMALSKGTLSKASGLSKSTTSGVSAPSQGTRRSHEASSYYSEAITDNTTRTQSTLIF